MTCMVTVNTDHMEPVVPQTTAELKLGMQPRPTQAKIHVEWLTLSPRAVTLMK